MAGILQAGDSWDAISDSLCDQEGYVADHEGWDRGVVARDLAAWRHFEAILLHGSSLLRDARQAVTQLNPDADTRRSWTHHLDTLATALSSARQLRDSWPTSAGPGIDPARSREELAAETWHEMNEWALHAPVLTDILRRTSTSPAPASSARTSAATLQSHSQTDPSDSRSNSAPASRDQPAQPPGRGR